MCPTIATDIERFGDDQDPNIHVGIIKDTEIPYCIELTIGEHKIKMHTRSAVDLHHKLGVGINDWFANVMLAELEGLL